MVKEIKEDIFKAKAQVMLHQANCFCRMEAGIARIIANKWPEVKKIDDWTGKGDRDKLGTISVVKINDENYKLVINLYSQFEYWGRGIKTNYHALENALRLTINYLDGRNKNLSQEEQIKIIAAPYKIGCGLAGGDWNTVKKILHNAFDKSNFTLLICEHE